MTERNSVEEWLGPKKDPFLSIEYCYVCADRRFSLGPNAQNDSFGENDGNPDVPMLVDPLVGNWTCNGQFTSRIFNPPDTISMQYQINFSVASLSESRYKFDYVRENFHPLARATLSGGGTAVLSNGQNQVTLRFGSTSTLDGKKQVPSPYIQSIYSLVGRQMTFTEATMRPSRGVEVVSRDGICEKN